MRLHAKWMLIIQYCPHYQNWLRKVGTFILRRMLFISCNACFIMSDELKVTIYEQNLIFFYPTQRFVCPIKVAYQTSQFRIEKGGCRNHCMDIFVVWKLLFLNSFVPLFKDFLFNIPIHFFTFFEFWAFLAFFATIVVMLLKMHWKGNAVCSKFLHFSFIKNYVEK